MVSFKSNLNKLNSSSKELLIEVTVNTKSKIETGARDINDNLNA